MFPLELGDQNLVFIILGGVILAGVIVVLILAMMRRASAMSDEISAQSKLKFEAITPTTSPSSNHRQITEVSEKARPPAETGRIMETGGYFALKKELLETKFQLERYIRENAPAMEKQRESLRDLEKVKTEVSGLRDRLSVDGQELQKVRTSVAEQGIKLHSQRRDIETQRSEIEKMSERREVENLRAEITTLKQRLAATEQELQKLRSSLPERVVDLQLMRGPQVREGLPLEVPRPASIVQPIVQGERQTLLAEPPAPVGVITGHCRTCGSALHIEDRYCIRCGHPIA